MTQGSFPDSSLSSPAASCKSSGIPAAPRRLDARLPPDLERTLGRLSHLQSCPPRKFAGRRQVPLGWSCRRQYGEKAAQMFTCLRLAYHRWLGLLTWTPAPAASLSTRSVSQRGPFPHDGPHTWKQ
ncbi:hypothetical protein CapIbe_001980 [Capra ibex]